MPLARFQLRNEYGLGVRELYRESLEKEDPKAVLDGVAVAGLVGLLRQLGDLAEFAAEVFHGLQEEVTTTASRSQKLMTRVKHVEAALPPIEKAILSQTGHIHFAYTPGSNWHARIRNEKNHFIYTDLPRCIMNFYEECREPPRLQLLDKFDTGGPGSCLKRYSDPTFLRKVSGNSNIVNDDKYRKGRKACKVKKRRSRSCQLASGASNLNLGDRMQLSSRSRPRRSSPSHTLSTDVTFKSDLVDHSDSLGSGERMGFIECVFHPSASIQPDETKIAQPLSGLDDKAKNTLESNYIGKQTAVLQDDIPASSVLKKNAHRSSSGIWDEKVEIVEPMVINSGMQEVSSLHESSFKFDKQEMEPAVWKSADNEVIKVNEANFEVVEPEIERTEWNSRSYEVTEVHETNFQHDDLDNEPTGQTSGSNKILEVHDDNFELYDPETEPLGQNSRGEEILELYETNLERDEQELAPAIGKSVNVIGTSFESTDSPNVIFDGSQPDDMESEADNFVDALNTIESESEKDLDCQTTREMELDTPAKDDVDDKRNAGNIDDHPLESESPSTSYNDLNQTDVDVSHGSTSSLLSASEKRLQHASAYTSGTEVCGNLDDLASPMHLADDAPLESIPSSSVQNISYEMHDDNADGLQQESDCGELSSQAKVTSMMAGTYEGTGCCPVSEQAPVESPSVSSVAFWTNGGLLGLQPSKPPDFNTSNSPGISTSGAACPSYQNLMTRDDNIQGKLVLPPERFVCDDRNAKPEALTVGSDNHEFGFSKSLPSQFSSSGVDGKLTKSIDSNQSDLLTNMMHPETKDLSSADARTTLNGKVHVDEDRSLPSGLGRGLLMNGFRRTRSMEYDEKPKAVSSQKVYNFENGPHGTFHHSFKETNFMELSSPVNSPPSSPPLEHMKISFQPIDNFETSKLKLKYPEGIDHHKENISAFPSFQLVPQPNWLQHDVVSDSDDDTFCRSNLCKSDDDLSHLSDSVWESGDGSESREDIPCDGLHRISNEESISSSAEHEEMINRRIHNDCETSGLHYKMDSTQSSSSPISDIPVLHAMNPFPYQETTISSKQDDLMGAFDMREPTPEPPPLPPLQWRVSKPPSDVVEGNGITPINYLSLFSNSKNPGSSFPYLSKPEPDMLNNTWTDDMNVIMSNKQLEQLKLDSDALEEINQAANRRVDEKGDFLHQIRTKSFNLRKTGLLKPSNTSTAPSTNVNVTAMLQKANAIRQAVASDDGEDTDPWSDT